MIPIKHLLIVSDQSPAIIYDFKKPHELGLNNLWDQMRGKVYAGPIKKHLKSIVKHETH